MLFRLRRPQTVFMTIAVFAVGAFVIMNIMVVQLNSFKSKSTIIFEMDQKRNYRVANSNSNSGEVNKVYVSHSRRKPKTTNNENTSDEEYIDLLNRNMEQDAKKKIVQGIVEFKKQNPKTFDHTYYENSHDHASDENGNNMENKDIIQMLSNHKKLKENRKEKIKQTEEIDKDNELENTEDIEKLDDEDDDYPDDYEEDDDDEDDDDEYDDTNKENPVFKPGDFGDIRGVEFFKKPKLKFKDLNAVEDGKKGREKQDTSQPELIEQGIYWSSYVDSLIPTGLSYSNVTKVIRSLHKASVQRLEKPAWERCGRPLNGLAILQDGTQVCARYRHPHITYVYGEVLSFYLSRLLGMDNVPAVVLARTDQASQQWKATNITKFGWENNITVALIEWISDLNGGTSSRSKMPDIILQAYKSGQPITANTVYKSRLQDREPADISEIVQWGNMIVFDYITGNYDRVASMQDAADVEQRPEIIEESIRNLRKSSHTNKLWLIDNECGLFDAYELLEMKAKFVKFHKQMLETMCVFQSYLVNAIQKLHKSSSPHTRLVNFAISLEPLMQYMPKDKRYEKFVNLFHKRLKDVYDWVQHCESLVR